VTELHVLIPDDVAERLAREAARRGTTPEELAAQRIIDSPPASGGSLAWVGMGHSGRHDLSERAKEIRQSAAGG
jgi:hypothetical protein